MIQRLIGKFIISEALRGTLMAKPVLSKIGSTMTLMIYFPFSDEIKQTAEQLLHRQ